MTRGASAVDEHGRYLAIGEQDRSRGTKARIREGLRALERSVRLRRPGEYQLQAAITALQMEEESDSPQIADLYGALTKLRPTAVVELNRAVAVGFADGLRRPRPALAAAARPGAQALPAAARRPCRAAQARR